MLWNALTDVLIVVYVLDCIFMGLVIMMQRSKQEGLGAAFGGGITESVWGAQTSNVLVKATVWATIIFFVLSITLARIYSHDAAVAEKGSTVQQELLNPVTPPKPAVTPNTSTNAPTATPTGSTTPAPAAQAPAPATPAPAPAAQTPAAPAKPASK